MTTVPCQAPFSSSPHNTYQDGGGGFSLRDKMGNIAESIAFGEGVIEDLLYATDNHKRPDNQKHLYNQ